jgi:hypothetical protein
MATLEEPVTSEEVAALREAIAAEQQAFSREALDVRSGDTRAIDGRRRTTT